MANKAENFVAREAQRYYYSGIAPLELALAITNGVCDKLKCKKIPPEYVQAIGNVCKEVQNGRSV